MIIIGKRWVTQTCENSKYWSLYSILEFKDPGCQSETVQPLAASTALPPPTDKQSLRRWLPGKRSRREPVAAGYGKLAHAAVVVRAAPTMLRTNWPLWSKMRRNWHQALSLLNLTLETTSWRVRLLALNNIYATRSKIMSLQKTAKKMIKLGKFSFTDVTFKYRHLQTYISSALESLNICSWNQRNWKKKNIKDILRHSESMSKTCMRGGQITSQNKQIYFILFSHISFYLYLLTFLATKKVLKIHHLL